jgi:hypothetical protein
MVIARKAIVGLPSTSLASVPSMHHYACRIATM